MNCYQCAAEGQQTPAVAICQHCGAAMCMRHLREEQATSGAGGTQIGCSHDLRAGASGSLTPR